MPAFAPDPTTPAPWRLAPPGWTPEQPNPYTADGSYGPGWSCFVLTTREGDQVRNGLGSGGLYAAVFDRDVPGLQQRLADFLGYEAARGRCVIVGGLEASFVGEALALPADPAAVRPSDLPWLVHSTSREAWRLVEACGELRSAALLAHGGTAVPTLGELLVGDPPDYAEYVALGTPEALGPEFVVACRQAQRMLPDPHVEYEPGVRLYFDAHRLIRDGLAVRDGLHTLKVHARLPLAPYLAAAISAEGVAPPDGASAWTTTAFRDYANASFGRSHAMP